MGKLSGGVAADTMEAYRQAVRRGAGLLDRRAALPEESLVPADWRRLLNRDRLDLGDPYLCVLGQIAASREPHVDGFGVLMLRLDLGELEAYHHGFATPGGLTGDYELLTLAWKQYLDECRAG